MSRNHVFGAVLLALSVVLVVAKAMEEMDRLPEILDEMELDI